MAPTPSSRLDPSRAIMLPDILTIIFECLVLGAGDDSNCPRFDESTPCDDWFPATHTCRTWRRVAIATTRIWGRIWTTMPPSLTRLFLQRSKSTPLYLWACGFETNVRTVTMVLDSHAARLKEVQIMNFAPAWIDPLFSMPTPQLESIRVFSTIELEEWDERDDDMHMPPRCSFSETAFHEGVPRLRSLSISGFTFVIDSPLLCNLTSLNLSQDHWDGEALDRLWPRELLHALRSMPHLRSLGVNKSFEPLPVLASSQPVAVTMPVLTHLRFQVEEMPDMKILQYLTLPSIKHIDLKCDEVGDPTKIPHIIPIVHALLPPHDSSTTQTALMLEAGTSDGTPKSRATFKLKVNPADKPPVDLKLEFIGTECFQTEDPLHAFRPLLGPINTLELDGYAEAQDGPVAFVTFFRAMTEVTKLRVNGLSDITFILQDALETPLEDAVGPMQYALPNLKKISLLPPRDLQDTEKLVGRVKELLLARKTLGAAIDVLEIVLKRSSIIKCMVTPQDLEPLTELIQVVLLPS